MAEPMVWVYEEQDMATFRLLGVVEEAWATMAWALISQDQVSAASLNGLVMCWPLSLYRRLRWGDQPHFGHLGGISQWQVEAIMESLDSTVAQVVSSSGRSPWTDAAWRHIAMMHVPQRPCPDCGYSGPASQMLQFGVIWACETCQGVTW